MSLKSWYRVSYSATENSGTEYARDYLFVKYSNGTSTDMKIVQQRFKKTNIPRGGGGGGGGGGQLSTWTKRGGIWNRHMGLPALLGGNLGCRIV